jgi:hypothetical protein
MTSASGVATSLDTWCDVAQPVSEAVTKRRQNGRERILRLGLISGHERQGAFANVIDEVQGLGSFSRSIRHGNPLLNR